MWHRVVAAGQIGVGQAAQFVVAGREIAIFNLAGVLHATDAVCTHAYARLVEGYIEDDTVECPLHAARFHIPSGRPLCAPASLPLRTYEVRVEGDGVFAVQVDEGAAPP